jgi:Zinc knuckle
MMVEIKGEFWKLNKRKAATASVNAVSKQDSKKKKYKKNVKCHNCGKKGHYQRECRSKDKDKDKKEKSDKKEKKPPGKISFVTYHDDSTTVWRAFSTSTKNKLLFLLDSGSNIHVCKDKWAFSKYQDSSGTLQGTGGEVEIEGIGSINIVSDTGVEMQLDNVRYVSGAGLNILSLSKFTELSSASVNMTKDQLTLTVNSTKVMTGRMLHGLYHTECGINK